MVIADLAKENEGEKVINETVNHFQKIDILVSIVFEFYLSL